jgi:osmoprotectant transport system permease protein
MSVGLATIAAAIGAGGLGEFIFRGLAMVTTESFWPEPFQPHSWR